MLYKAFAVVGVLNVTTYDAGLSSLVKMPVHVNAIIINISAYEGNVIEAWVGNKRLVEIYDYNLDTQDETAGATAPYSTVKMGRIPVEEDIKPGQVFRVAVNCGAVANNLFGAYEYTETEA